MNKPLRIAFASVNCNRQDGTSRPVAEVAERLARRGHEVTVFSRTMTDVDRKLVKWVPVSGPLRPQLANFWTFYVKCSRILSRQNYDIIHTIGANVRSADVVTIQNIQPAKALIVRKLSLVEKISPVRQFTRRWYEHVTGCKENELYSSGRPERPMLFLPVSKGVEGELRQHYKIGAAKCRIVPNGADTSHFRPISLEERSRWRADNSLADSDLVLFFCGGEWARKGLDLLLHALARLGDAKVKLLVAGDDPDRMRYRNLCITLGIAPQVVFAGFRRDIATAAASTDIFAFPSFYEAFSLATIEAAACGLPVVATKINGAEDFIRPGENGMFIRPDPQHIADTLRPLLSSPEHRRELGANARKLVESKYTWDHVAELTENAYSEHLANRLLAA